MMLRIFWMSTVLSSLNSGIESVVKGFINQTLDEIKGIPHKVYDIYEKLRGIKEYGSKVKEINNRLKGAAKEGSDLGLSLGTRAMSSRSRVFSQRPPTTSLVNKSSVFGRDEDKEKIIEFLLRDEATASDNNFSVLPIVGMGGLGKTTLAQLVYDADRLIQHFDLKAWVCVGEEFDILKITKEILESVTGRKPETDLLARLQNQLQQELSKKKFFMVLDDVWNLNYNKWDTLKTPFAAGALGSKILVTTRDKKVSSIMRTVTAHQLERLSDEACIHLLRGHAFVDGNSLDADRKLEIFGSKVA
ncbi:putative disease resistance RPP13-like protein 1 [Macadamia integrifolia]|uniref:putative disease resistance RPP13-like protein 1 n=1 Tax=Macadamia integrifolia TaxID=60698 RepID=UPI001C4FF941|nr:putative disease resistance RPP13-like protein 1 [Macadamia integrifolia]